MTEIAVSPAGGRVFDVRVRDGSQETRHRVSVPARIGELDVADEQAGRVVEESFRFLLEREPATSILREFSLDEIAHYFPEYPQELPRRLA